jgi:hypothetical protein
MPLIAALILAFVGHASSSAAPRVPCGLLTPAEAGEAGGGTAKPSVATTVRIAAGRARDKTVHECSWTVATARSLIEVNLIQSLDSSARADAYLTLNAHVNAARGRKWTDETKTFGDVTCTTVSPAKPTKERSISACVGSPKGAALYVAVTSPTRTLSPDETKVFFDKAAARLPDPQAK